ELLGPHPQIPVLATSGLDDDVKIWVPSCEQEPTMAGLRSAVVSNYKGREDDRQRDPDAFDGQMLWILWRHIRRTERRRNQMEVVDKDPPQLIKIQVLLFIFFLLILVDLKLRLYQLIEYLDNLMIVNVY
ncbi:hypothetical protein L9F63_026167, partial [Diploptera punctata]